MESYVFWLALPDITRTVLFVERCPRRILPLAASSSTDALAGNLLLDSLSWTAPLLPTNTLPPWTFPPPGVVCITSSHLPPRDSSRRIGDDATTVEWSLDRSNGLKLLYWGTLRSVVSALSFSQ
jgi:hypothetical protein